MKRMIIGALCGALLACLGSWLDGYDFNSRGSMAVVTLMLVMVLGWAGGACGYITKGFTRENHHES